MIILSILILIIFLPLIPVWFSRVDFGVQDFIGLLFFVVPPITLSLAEIIRSIKL